MPHNSTYVSTDVNHTQQGPANHAGKRAHANRDASYRALWPRFAGIGREDNSRMAFHTAFHTANTLCEMRPSRELQDSLKSARTYAWLALPVRARHHGISS